MERRIKLATIFANLLDNRFRISGVRFGFNAILSLIPGLGDLAAALLSLYLIWIAARMRLPTIKMIQMFWNIFVNFMIGLVPIIGDTVYLFRKANLKNLEILREYIKKNVAAESL